MCRSGLKKKLIIRAEVSRDCLYVYPGDIPKTDGARITKLDIQMFHHKFQKSIYFEVKRSKLKGQGYESQKQWVFALLWVPAF